MSVRGGGRGAMGARGGAGKEGVTDGQRIGQHQIMRRLKQLPGIRIRVTEQRSKGPSWLMVQNITNVIQQVYLRHLRCSQEVVAGGGV